MEFSGFRPRVSSQSKTCHARWQTADSTSSMLAVQEAAPKFQTDRTVDKTVAPPVRSIYQTRSHASRYLQGLVDKHASLLVDTTVPLSWRVQAAYELNRIFGQLKTYAAAEALATCMPAWPMFAALAELLLAAPGCSFILLGVLVQLTFNSDAVATLTSNLQSSDGLGGVLCGMFRALRSLPHAAAVALLQSVVNIGRGPRGVVWLHEAGFTLASSVRLARGINVPTSDGGGQVGADVADARRGAGGGVVGDAGVTGGALRLHGLLHEVVFLLLDSAYGWKATQRQPELEAQAKDIVAKCTD